MIGSYYYKSKYFSILEKIYIFIFGIPVLGLRIRFWNVFPLITRYFKDSKNILDIGSGRGLFTIETARYFKDSFIYGIDMNERNLNISKDIAQKLCLTNCFFINKDIFDTEFDKKFDGILAVDILEHIEDDLSFVRRVYNLLERGGVFIVHVPHKFRNIFGFKRINFDIEGHLRPGYLMDDLEKLFHKADFKIIEKGYVYSSLETLANDISYLITNGREKRKLLYALFFQLFYLLHF